ncbi:MAG: transglycosylase SLT domain-containing protein [Calditrichaeota bacterium]|nr:transglycosylase SLT domain-containing protein [Calditrichota bacterium]
MIRVGFWQRIFPVMWAVLLVYAQEAGAVENPFDQANRWYQQGRYEEALQAYTRAVQQFPHLGKNSLMISSKIGICFFETGQYGKAHRLFALLSRKPSSIRDFLRFYQIQSHLKADPDGMPIGTLRDFESRFPESPLAPVADSLLGAYYLEKGMLDSSVYYYRRVLMRALRPHPAIYARLFRISLQQGAFAAAESYAKTVLQKFPQDTSARAMYAWLSERFFQTGNASLFRLLFDYLLRSGQLSRASDLLERYASRWGKTEMFYGYRLRWLYQSRQYRAVVQMVHQKRRYFRQQRYLRDADLYLARAYLRLGQRKQSIQAYLQFQKRYPRDKLAAEVLWKVAWLYEEQWAFDRAQKIYRQLARQYPRSRYGTEARFREGLIAYRKMAYRKARTLWEHHLKRERDADAQMRLRYWIAKTYLKEGDYLTYLERLGELARHPFQTYYNLKAYLLTRDGQGVHQRIDSILWNIHREQLSVLPHYLTELERCIYIQEIFGPRFLELEYRYLLRNGPTEDWQFLYALGELQERWGNYGRAFRLFRRVFFQEFVKQDWEDQLFLFKRLYPLYYYDLIMENARRWELSPALLLAIMKKESAFETRITSYANAYGLMQLIPPTAEQVSRQLGEPLKNNFQLFDPARNILLGSYYFKSLLKRYKGNVYYALAAYNAGPNRVDRWSKVLSTEDDDFFMENIEFEQTRRYVRVVMRYYWTYSLLLHPGRVPAELLVFPEKIVNQMESNSGEELDETF